MNIYGVIILAALLAEYLLSVTAGLLNIRALGQGLPEEFVGVYDADAYWKSQQYTRLRTWFSLIEETFGLAVILLFWFASGFESLDRIVRGWDLAPIWSGLAYIGILLLARAILALPFTIYSTFVIEARFGFNRTTIPLFVADIIKGLLLAILLGGPLLAGVLAFFQYAGTSAWLYCWAAATLFILVIQFILPTWIMPLFNRYQPLEEGDLRRSILDYARSVDFSLANIFVMDGSRRSTKSNAFFTGFGKGKRVALFDTLIARHSTPELVAVVAHEIGHYKRHHIVQGIVLGIVHTGILFFLLSIFVKRQELFDAFYMSHVSVYAGLLFFALLFSPIELLIGVMMQILSRKNEYESDSFAASTTGSPQTMIDALKKLAANNLSNLTPHPFYTFLYYTHPPVIERIRALRGMRLGT
jgi:STE24 endopeptidase